MNEVRYEDDCGTTLVATADQSRCACYCAEYLPVGEKAGRLVVRCRLCGLVRTLNVPADYEALYLDGLAYHADRTGQVPYVIRAMHDYRVAGIRWAEHFARMRCRVLDVGCANGGFLKYLKDQGCIAEGVEPNPTIAQFAAEASGCPVYPTVKAANGPYDVITLHDVLEHARSPQAFLEDIATLMTPRTLLIIDTPDVEDPRFETLGMDWHHMKPVEHLWFFDARTLTDVVQRAGLFVRELVRPIQGKLVAYCGRLRG